MPHIVFVAPRFMENTNRYVKAFASLDGVTLSVVSLMIHPTPSRRR